MWRRIMQESQCTGASRFRLSVHVGYAIPETADMLMGNYADYDGTLRPYETVVYAVQAGAGRKSLNIGGD